jgi:ABC-type sugar transport system substrate-binding protein
MRRRVVAMLLAVGALGGVLAGPGAALAQAGPTVPPVCVKQPLPNPFLPGAQIQVGYCP